VSGYINSEQHLVVLFTGSTSSAQKHVPAQPVDATLNSNSTCIDGSGVPTTYFVANWITAKDKGAASAARYEGIVDTFVQLFSPVPVT
jgi:hypothetical protein